MSSIKFRLLLTAMLATTLCVNSQTNVRGLYVNGTSTWLGDTARENQVLRYLQLLDYNSITLYDLNFAWTSAQNNNLASFINKAKVNYGVSQVGVAGETYNYFYYNVIPYNNSRTKSSEKIDVLNFEFEFWLQSSINAYYNLCYLAPNGYSSDTAGAFAFAWKEFQLIDGLCSANGMISEIYLGWPTLGQMQKIASIADRILIHAYRTSDFDVYPFTQPRLMDIASLQKPVNVMPIFSSEPVFMQNWLTTNPISKAYQTYSSGYSVDTTSVKQYINLTGYQWFVYSTMPGIFKDATIASSGPLTFCPGGSVTLTANQGSAYLWTPGGATTRSITVNTAGNYAVRVTDTLGYVSTSFPVTTAISTIAPPPLITSSGSLKICQGRSVTLTASPADSYNWSNGATTQSITAIASGVYTVTTKLPGCSASSASTTVQVVTQLPTPVITSSGSLQVCPGAPVTLTSSPADGYLWSDGSTTRSITVNTTGNYSVRVYNAPFCAKTSLQTSVVQLPAPPVPAITISGPTTLTSSNPTTTLVSSVANAYEWSSGHTSRSIVVNSQGSFRVTVAGANGCKSVSPPVSISANGCAPPPIPFITPTGSTILTPGETVTLICSNGAGYLWSNGSTSQSITVSTAGTYSVRVYNAGSCFSTSLPITVKIVPARMKTSQNENLIPEVPLNIFPNPAHGNFRMTFSSETDSKGVFRIINGFGSIVMEKSIEAITGRNEMNFDISSLSAGVYYSQLLLNGRTEVKNIVVTD